MSEPDILPAEPNVFGPVVESDGIKYRQRWLPGAFGDRENIADVESYTVKRNYVEIATDDVYEHTIIEARVLTLREEVKA